MPAGSSSETAGATRESAVAVFSSSNDTHVSYLRDVKHVSTTSASSWEMPLDAIRRIRRTIGSHCSRVFASTASTRPSVWQRVHFCSVTAQAWLVCGFADKDCRARGSPQAASKTTNVSALIVLRSFRNPIPYQRQLSGGEVRRTVVRHARAIRRRDTELLRQDARTRVAGNDDARTGVVAAAAK